MSAHTVSAHAIAVEPLVELRDLAIRFPARYGDRMVVDGVSLSLAAGETVGLVGESGSGKTLIGRAVLGHLPATAVATGNVRVAGVDVLTADRAELASLRGGVAAAVFQDALVALNPTRTIGGHFADVWAATGRAHSELAAEAAQALEMAALPEVPRVLGSYPHELSGGMRQRALIALALLRRPSVLIADEPTSALDRVVAGDVLATLESLRDSLGLTMLLISHDFDVIRRLCSRVAVLYGGQLCEVGMTEELMTEHVHPYSAGLIDSVRSLAERRKPLGTIPGTVPSPDQFTSGCRFANRCLRATDECLTPRPRVVQGGLTGWCHHPLLAGTKVADG